VQGEHDLLRLQGRHDLTGEQLLESRTLRFLIARLSQSEAINTIISPMSNVINCLLRVVAIL
jgi:hypothetical protein